MKQKDHLALAYELLRLTGDGPLWKKEGNRRLFLIGCVCPDYLPFTYLRGFWRGSRMKGHSLPYSAHRIEKTLGRLQKRGVGSRRDCLSLGMLMHYLADSFTYVHTEGFSGSVGAHRDYEDRLHACFKFCRAPSRQKLSGATTDLYRYLRRAWQEPYGTTPNPRRDCRRILFFCGIAFLALTENQNSKGD